MTPLLDIQQLAISFGGLKAVQGFCLSLPEGELHGLIGPNGAGKTTVFNLITGVYRPDSGTMTLDGRSLLGLRPHRITAAGVARTFQNIRLFGDLTVLDNVRIGCHLRARHGMPAALFRTRGHIAEDRAITERSLQLLALMGLAHRRDERARNLPYGDQRRLEIARALATDPKVLLLDEPAAGMNSAEKRDLAGLINRLRNELGLTLLLIEHDMGLVMQVCDGITVLDHGQVIACGPPADIQQNPKVIEAYLGEPVEAGQP